MTMTTGALLDRTKVPWARLQNSRRLRTILRFPQMQKMKQLHAIYAESAPQLQKILSPAQYQQLQAIRETLFSKRSRVWRKTR